jgi:digeranylgeranylglycerophospholipid reductase
MPCLVANRKSPVTEFDVIVVGAGPAGSEAARASANAGLRTLLVEEHSTVGSPSHCTGKLSHHAFREFDLPVALAQNAVSAAVFHSPGGASVHVRRATVDSYVVDRVAFDRWLVTRAGDAGARVVTGVRVTQAQREDGVMVVRGQRRAPRAETFDARCRVIIDAEGASPRLPGTLGLRLLRRYALGLQYEMRDVGGLMPDTPETFFGSGIAPGFFAWLMPLGGHRARVGLCVDPRKTTRPPVWYLERLLATHPALRDRVAGASVERKVAGRIPLLTTPSRTGADGMIVVGDAAGQVKATSGGGIYFAMLAGRIAGEVAGRYVAGDRTAVAVYERRWRRRFGREVAFTAFGRHAINRLSDGELDLVLRVIAESPRLRASIERAGDTQFQSHLFLPLLRGLASVGLRRPVVIPLVGKALLHGMLAQG